MRYLLIILFVISFIPAAQAKTHVGDWDITGKLSSTYGIKGRVWNILEEYDQGDIVSSGSSVYISLQNVNTGNLVTDPVWWVAVTGGGGSTTFLGLTDTPGTYTSNYYIKVNSAGDALEFVVPPSGTTDLSNTPAASTLEIQSSSGSNTTLPAATTSLSGVMTGADKTNVDANATHRTSTGADHTYVDQSVVNGSSPTLDGNNFTGIDADNVDIADVGGIIAATEVEGALQENRTAIDLNTPKETNVSTALSEGTVTSTTYGITSDGGVDDLVLPEADTTNAGLLSATKWDDIVVNSAKVTNATHTGEVTGSGVLIIADDIIEAANIADGDHGAFTYTANVATLNANSVDSNQYVDNSINAVHISDFYGYSEIPISYMEGGISEPGILDSGTRKPYAYRDFDSTADEDLIFTWLVPQDLSGTTIQFRVYYLITDATGPTVTEGVAFGLSGVSIGDNDPTNATKGTVVVVTDDTLDAAQWDGMITGWSGDVTVTDLLAGETAEMAFIRDVSDTVDDYPKDIGPYFLVIRYVKNPTR